MAESPATPSGAIARDSRCASVVDFYQTLTPAALHRLDKTYAADARFIDPFNDVTGHAAICRVFEHMFASLDAPRFEVTQTVSEGEHCFLLWNFHFRRKGQHRDRLIHGSTHVRFAPDGRIAWHRDYWDAAREVYESVPLLGAVLRALRRRLSAGG